MNRGHFDIARVATGPASMGFGWLTLPLYRDHLAGTSLPQESVETIAIGARVGATPAGLLVAERLRGGHTRVVSTVVRPRFRRMGCARQLLGHLEASLGRSDGETLVVGALASMAPALESTLTRLGFGAWQQRGTSWELTADRLDALVRRRRRWLSTGLRAVPWATLPQAARDDVLARQARAPWYPESLSPFRHQTCIEPTTSLALMASGEVAGWAIGHRVSEDAVHYATIFVRPDLRHLGAGAGLFFTALTRHCTSPATRRCRGRFLVRDESTRMAQMIERRIRPLAATRSTYLEAEKALP